MNKDKQQVQDFGKDASCRENLYLPKLDRAVYEAQSRKRYELEPYIQEFSGFDSPKAMRLLEIGVGLSAEHQHFLYDVRAQ